MEEQRIAKTHKLVVNNRKTSMVTGVLDVLSFDLNEILLETEQGKGRSICRETLTVSHIPAPLRPENRARAFWPSCLSRRPLCLESEQKRESFSMPGCRGRSSSLHTGFLCASGK